MTTKLSVGLVLNGPAEDVISFKPELERLLNEKGFRVIFSKTSVRRLFIIEDSEYQGGGSQ